MMRVVSSRMAQAERIARRLKAGRKNLVVFFNIKGDLDSCAAGSERHEAMMRSADFIKRVVGVFSPDSNAAMILREAF